MTTDTQKTTQDAVSESAALKEIVGWAATRPPWQQDALGILIETGTISDSDLDSLVATCIDPILSTGKLKKYSDSSSDSSKDPVSLIAIRDPLGINALADGQELKFAPSGLTIIYGDNGSGKSGYVRILKSACHTRDGNTQILRDLEDTQETPQSATIEYRKGLGDETVHWEPSKDSNSDLPSVSIFDSRSANIHVEKTNAVAYIPRPMQILERLAACCDDVKAKLVAQIAELRSKTPAAIKNPSLSKDSAAGAFLHSLSGTSKVSQLEALSEFTGEDEKRLQTLEADLSQSGPVLRATLTSQLSRLEDLLRRTDALCAASDAENFAKRDELEELVNTTTEAAKAASSELFSSAALPDIGQEAWKQLWQSARHYSDSAAYKNKEFPRLDVPGDLCVLCHQPLTEEVISRWTTFEDYIQGSTQAAADKAAKNLAEWNQTLSSSLMSTSDIRGICELIEAELSNKSLAKEIRRYGLISAWRLRALMRGASAPCKAPVRPDLGIVEAVKSLEGRISEISTSEDSPERLALEKEVIELTDCRNLQLIREDVRSEIERLAEIVKLQTAVKKTAKNTVTLKNKEITDKIVTNALRGRFSREVDKLKLTCAPVELRKIKDRSAVSYFQVVFVERPDEPVADIFSEGEHRCVALAAFLAELVTSSDYSGIVFDDPMSSLDHIHRKSVAARLVEEAAHRQVIIFTHDLTFLYELRRESEAKGVSVHYQTIRSKNSKPGFVESELPTKAKSAREMVAALRQELKADKGEFDQWKEQRRVLFCKGFIEQLREAWDQGIADFIFPVLGRFENAIKGSTLYKLEVLTEDDVKTVTSARSRLSEDLHASAETLNPTEVSHQQLKDEIGKLEDWLADIFERQKNAEKPSVSYT